MILLNDYLYSGNTVNRILRRYREALAQDAQDNGNAMSAMHCDFLTQIMGLIEHNDFLTSQSQRIREFYKYMAAEYPFLAFTFKGRIKSIIRAEEKFNGYVVEYIYGYYKENGRFPEVEELKAHVGYFRDLIAYRIVISLPKCNLKPGQDLEEAEQAYLYEIANALPAFLMARGFTPEDSDFAAPPSDKLSLNVAGFYRDYVANPSDFGYQSLHITLFDNVSGCPIELQLRTKRMDDYAEIGPANHVGYEKRQDRERSRRSEIPEGENIYFDQAYERVRALQELDLAGIDVNMFSAINNDLINDGCGLYKGRLILPFEHLSKFQNDIVD